MNEDYLWDKSGEPDPQIQQLEEILGTLRYQPKPLRIPAGLSLHHRRRYFAIAIAAAVVIALVAAGLWVQVNSRKATIAAVPIAPTPTPQTIRFTFDTVSTHKSRKAVIVRHDTQEALAAKQQLMFALRLASEKLNSAYRRTQTPTQIKNQHKAG
jgi:hypothetical protein